MRRWGAKENFKLASFKKPPPICVGTLATTQDGSAARRIVSDNSGWQIRINFVGNHPTVFITPAEVNMLDGPDGRHVFFKQIVASDSSFRGTSDF